MIFKKNKIITDVFALCSLVSIVINTIFLRSFIRDWNIYPSLIMPFFNLIIYFLEYIIIPIFFIIFYFVNGSFKVNYNIIFLTLIHPLFYFIEGYFFNLFMNWSEEKIFSTDFFSKQFINPDNQKNLFISYLKIFLAFFALTTGIIFLQKNKKPLLFKFFSFVFLLLFISFIALQPKEWLHAKEVVLNPTTMGSGLFPETQEMSEYFQTVSNLTPEELKKDNNKILELGSGCGNVTQYLIEKFGIENIITIEIDEFLCQELKARFSGLKVIQGNAANFENLLKQEKITNKQIKGIVSTLPVGIFNNKDFKNLKNSIEKIVSANNIKYMNYRFKMFETENREMQEIKKSNNFVFISEMVMPLSVYTYVKK
jgi:phospholipid N-methyltransferase